MLVVAPGVVIVAALSLVLMPAFSTFLPGGSPFDSVGFAGAANAPAADWPGGGLRPGAQEREARSDARVAAAVVAPLREGASKSRRVLSWPQADCRLTAYSKLRSLHDRLMRRIRTVR